jgi:hypothetical protein
MELWYIGLDGSVRDWYFGESQGWKNFVLAERGQAAPGSKMCSVSKSAGHMEVWWVSSTGSIEGAFWYDGKGWKRYQLAPAGSTSIGAHLTAVSREPKAMELWWIGLDGSLQGAWNYDSPEWHRYSLAPLGSVAADGGIRAHSRQSNMINVVWISKSGSLEGAFEIVGHPWQRYQIAPQGSASLTSSISSVHRNQTTEEIWWITPAGGMMNAWRYDPDPPTAFKVFQATPNGSVRPNSAIAGVSRLPETMETWYTAADGGLGDRYYYDARSKTFSQNIISHGLAALGGWTSVVIDESGSLQWNGDGHDSGADDYDYGVVGYLHPRAGAKLAPIICVHHGKVQGHIIGSGGRDDPWRERRDQPMLITHYDDYANGTFELNVQYSSGILNTLESVFNSALKWTVGTLLEGAGLLIFIGVEVGSLVSTGSLAAGATILNGVLYMAGPGNTLLAIVAGGVAAVGSRSNTISQSDYDQANADVFGGTLPPRDHIRITDTKGLGGRAFTFPMADGSITINVGGMPGFFDKPSNFRDVLVHELTHAWQIQHKPFQLGLLAEALSLQLKGSTSYDYPDPGFPFRELNLEAMAQMVQDWYRGANPADPRNKMRGGPRDEGSAYFPYIRDKIRMGIWE